MSAELDEARNTNAQLRGEIEGLRADLDRVSREAAAQREALVELKEEAASHNISESDGWTRTSPFLEIPAATLNKVNAALASDAGRGFVPEAEVERRVAETWEAAADLAYERGRHASDHDSEMGCPACSIAYDLRARGKKP